MRRVVITGYEAVSGFGVGTSRLWAGLVSGSNAIRLIESFDSATLPIRIAGDVPTIPWQDLMAAGPLASIAVPESRSARMAVIATKHALEHAGLDFLAWPDPERVGLFIADRETSAAWYIEETAPLYAASLGSGGAVDYGTFFDLMRRNRALERYRELDPEKPALAVQSRFGIEGPNVSVGTACASSNDGIGQAAQHIRNGNVDIVLAGGVFDLDLIGMIGFTRLGALTPNPDPEQASRPFDKNRDGFVMGSGCGIVVLEEYEAARRRGATIFSEVAGYGNCCDAYRATDPHPDAEGAYRAILIAMREAGIGPREIGYVAAHGTSTKLNDRTETIAIKRALGEHAYRTPISASKSMIGHTIMAAGAIQAIIVCETFASGAVHPTRNMAERDPECDLDYVQAEARQSKVDVALSNSFGFGGQNSSLILRRI
jgi:3-oxoacyl-[acyl-carrier-protein] synthase II